MGFGLTQALRRGLSLSGDFYPDSCYTWKRKKLEYRGRQESLAADSAPAERCLELNVVQWADEQGDSGEPTNQTTVLP